MTHRATSIIDKHIRDGGFAGAALVVFRNGQKILEYYAGEAAPGLASGPDVLWPIASISKVYSAAMIMRLVEEGVLTLNLPVCEILPAFSGEVRLRHLLTHTAGMIYESPEMEAKLIAQTPMSDLIEEAIQSPLLFKPGSSVRYSDYHYLVAGHMASTATGTPFPDLVRTLVIEPGDLGETFLPPGPEDEGRLAQVRGVMAEGTPGAMYNSRHARALAHPAFAVYSTAADLARFGLLFAPGGPRILSEAAVEAMTTDQTGGAPGQHPSLKGLPSDARIPWGIGFALQTRQVPFLFSDLASPRTFGHGGASGCQLVIDPVAGLVVALVSNTHLSTGRERWSMRLQSIVNAVFVEPALPPAAGVWT